MIKQILHSQQDKLELKKKLKSFVDTVNKNPSQLQQQLNRDILPEISKKFTSISFGLTVDLIFNGLSIQQSLQYAGYPTNQESLLLELLQIVLQENIPEKYIKFSAAYDRHSTLEKGLALIKGFSKHCVKQNIENCLPKLIPRFIRLCSFIIEKYLKLKNQPAHGTQDRLQHDKIILQNCEKWVASRIKQFFANMTAPSEQQIKKCTLFGLGDLIGAILQLRRQNILSSQILDDLLDNTMIPYICKNYSYQTIYQIFINNMKHNGYANPEQKIQIPQKYQLQDFRNFNTQTFCYFTKKLFNISGNLYYKNHSLKYLALAYSEIITRPYQMKLEISNRFISLLEKVGGLKIITGQQFNYPIGLILFYTWNSYKQNYETIRKCLKFEEQSVLVNVLIQLKMIKIQGLGSQQNQFILTLINRQKLVNIRLLIIFRQILGQGLLGSKHEQTLISIYRILLKSENKQIFKEFMDKLKKQNKLTEKTYQSIISVQQ